MARIIPKLNLNKTPQLVDNNSLVFAKNIRLLKDGTIGPDTSLEEIETNTGDSTHHVVHHDAVTRIVRSAHYSILDYENTLNAYNHLPLRTEPAFVFRNDIEDYEYDDEYQLSDEAKYDLIPVEESHFISCYRLVDDIRPVWCRELFTFNTNIDHLETTGGLVLLIGIREELVNNTALAPIPAPPFFYFIAPRNLEGTTLYKVFVRDATYVVFNPVYKTIASENVVVQDAYDEEWDTYDTVKYIAHIVGLNNKVYFFKENNYIIDSVAARTAIYSEYPFEVFVGDTPADNQTETFDVDLEGYVTRNGRRFQDSSISAQLTPEFNDRVKIFEYDEVENTFTIVKCGWHYSGGKINGCVTLNNRGELILTVCEYDANRNIPIKHINVETCTENDDESIYTQTPKIPITNLLLSDYYAKPIPKGVYQFFIRYEIRKGFYTTWFPCTKELFISNDHRKKTIQGGIKYAEKVEDSQLSFVFQVQHLFDVNGPEDNTKFYKSYQLGFIISSESGVLARSWKHFSFTTTSIYFDYEQKDIQEISIDDLLKTNYELFNVENITSFKDKLYIANYNETDFNEDLQTYASQIQVSFKIKEFETVEGYYIGSELLTPINYDTSLQTHEYTNWGEQHISDIILNRNVTSLFLYHIHPNHWDLSMRSQVAIINNRWYNCYGSTVSYYGSTSDYTLRNGATIYRVGLHVMSGNDAGIYDIIDNLHGRQIPSLLDYSDVDTFVPSTDYNSITDYVAQLVKPYITKLCVHTGQPTTAGFKIACTRNGSNYEFEVDNSTCKLFVLYHIVANVEEIQVPYVSYPNFLLNASSEDSFCDINFITSVLDSTTVEIRDTDEYNTLMPFTKYNFYVHYVKENGITTNGYFICSKELKRYTTGYERVDDIGAEADQERIDSGWPLWDSDIPHITGYPELDPTDLCVYDENSPEFVEARFEAGMGSYYSIYYRLQTPKNNSAIYPVFDNIVCPTGYVACFISIHKSGSDVAEIFNHTKDIIREADTITSVKDFGDCIELDSMLYSNLNNIKIVNGVGDYVLSLNGKYKSSSDTEDVEDFGKVGKIVWDSLDGRNPTYEDPICWAIFNNGTANIDENNLLTKLTPYILLDTSAVSYGTYSNLNLPAFVCKVVKPDRTVADNYYVTGNDVYDRGITGANPLELRINEDRIDLVSSGSTKFIHSNFNLNHLFLRSDLNIKFRTYYEAQQGSNSSVSKHQFIYAIDSSLISFIYELHSMYRNYAKKQYHVFNLKNNVIRFDTTVRSSDINVDEYYKNIYYFEAVDYYNVPANRGIIKNLIGVANTLYVHCEHSLFKFSDNKSITANDEEVSLQESDVFNTGISEVFDAQFGYGGLKDRKQSLVTFNAYVFYDSVAKVIYAFGGEQQIANIGEPIQKIIDAVNPTDVQFVGDELNDRFFVNLRNENGNVCLSFNFKAKAFVSIHDIDFTFGFHTRRHTYFIHDNLFAGNIIGWSIYRITDKVIVNNTVNYIAYRNCYTPSLLSIQDMPVPTGVNAASACIDVITNVEYEKIKVLNYLNWVCSEIISYGSDLNFTAEEELNRLYPGDKLRIYSDSTSTKLFTLVYDNGDARISNLQRNIDSNGNIMPITESWQYPAYNCGVFSINYFRNIIKNGNVYTSTNDDIFDYNDAPNIGPNGLVDLTEYTQRQDLTQENSLVYGKYFVCRFIFTNRNFKIENITFRMNDYGKTR